MKTSTAVCAGVLTILLGTGSAFAGGGDVHGDPGTLSDHARARMNPGASEAGVPVSNDAAARQTLELVLSPDDKAGMQRLTLHRDDIVRFVLRNPAKDPALVILGQQAIAASHAVMMRNYADMAHTAPGRVTVRANQQETLTWQFTRKGDFTLSQINAAKREAKIKVQIEVSE